VRGGGQTRAQSGFSHGLQGWRGHAITPQWRCVPTHPPACCEQEKEALPKGQLSEHYEEGVLFVTYRCGGFDVFGGEPALCQASEKALDTDSQRESHLAFVTLLLADGVRPAAHPAAL
jgi:hypothetical protein